MIAVPLTDKFGRAITDLRISITDRCNYKCVYCRTGNGGALYGDLPFEDYLRMARVLVGLGIRKIRLTGGGRWRGCWWGWGLRRSGGLAGSRCCARVWWTLCVSWHNSVRRTAEAAASRST